MWEITNTFTGNGVVYATDAFPKYSVEVVEHYDKTLVDIYHDGEIQVSWEYIGNHMKNESKIKEILDSCMACFEVWQLPSKS